MSILKNIAERINGISTPLGGLSWESGPNEQREIYNLLQKLSNRRLIRHYHGGFEFKAVVRSCEAIREYLTDSLCRLPMNSGARAILEEARMQVHLFQTLVEERYPEERYDWTKDGQEARPKDDVLQALHNLQVSIGEIINGLSHDFGIKTSDDKYWTTGFTVEPLHKENRD